MCKGVVARAIREERELQHGLSKRSAKKRIDNEEERSPRSSARASGRERRGEPHWHAVNHRCRSIEVLEQRGISGLSDRGGDGESPAARVGGLARRGGGSERRGGGVHAEIEEGEGLLSELVNVLVGDVPEVGYEGGAVASEGARSAFGSGERRTWEVTHQPAIM